MRLRSQAGFTLLELIVATTIIGVLALMVSGFYVDRVVDYAQSNTLLILQGNTKQALESMQRDIKSAVAVESANHIADPNGPGGNQFGWASSTGSPSTLVLAVPARDSSGNLLYADTQHTTALTDDVIYYISGNDKTMYRRVLANPATGNVAKTTCPPSKATASCPADGKVIEDVANLVNTYYDTNNVATNTLASAYSVNTYLTQSRTQFGRTYSNSLNSRATLRNKP
jgi:prepilin-type N-terminal cleavage/methylation domain-containing protein